MTKKKNNKSKFAFLLWIVLGLIIVISFFTFVSSGSFFMNPFLALSRKNSTENKNFVQAFKNSQQLISRNKVLEMENGFLRDEIVTLEDLAIENERLKQVLDYQKTTVKKNTVAKIISIDNTGGETTLVIDKGSRDSLAKNDLVLSESGVLLGEVYKVSSNFSFVRLATNPNFNLAVRSKERSSLGILRGDFSTGLTIELIPLDTELASGDEVQTNNFNNRPAGIRIGTINQIIEIPGALFKKAVVDHYFDLEGLIFVQVVSNQGL